MKEFVMPLVEPVGALWTLMCVSLGWLVLRKRWQSAASIGITTVLLFLLGSTPICDFAIERAESEFAGNAIGVNLAAAPNCDVVVVLGGGYEVSAHDSYGFALNSGSSRLLTAVELVRQGKAKRLVLGGSAPPTGPGQELMMARVEKWMTNWDLVGCPVSNLGICRNTHEEAIAFSRLKETNGWARVILVTSALHMKRAEAVFRKLGIEVTPVACDFQAYGVPGRPFSVFPRQEQLRRLSMYFHERLGSFAYRVRGWV